MDPIAYLGETDFGPVRPTVPLDVGDRFLGDAVDRRLQERLQPFKLHVCDQLDRRPVRRLLPDQAIDGGDHSRGVEDRRPQAANEPSPLADRFAHQPQRQCDPIADRAGGHLTTT